MRQFLLSLVECPSRSCSFWKGRCSRGTSETQNRKACLQAKIFDNLPSFFGWHR